MAFSKRELMRQFQELATLTKLEDGNAQSFRVRAYENALRALEDLSGPIDDLSESELAGLSGIGKSTAKKIREFIDTGVVAKLTELRDKYPPGIVELTRIPGLGPKTVIQLRDSLGIQDVEGLKEAVAAEQLRTLPGLGAKSEEKIAKAIERLGLHGKDRRTPIAEAMGVAAEVVAAVRDLPGVVEAAYCGSLRRLSDTIGDVDVVVATGGDTEPIMEAFIGLPMVADVVAHGASKSSVLIRSGLQIDVRVVSPAEYGAAMLYFTGSKEHNIDLRQRALKKGWTLNEYALSDVETEEVIAAATEEDIYSALGVAFVPPELRESHGELDGPLPEFADVADIRGDLHVHSDWSGDGRSPLEAMVKAAQDRGLRYMALTDHAEDLAINGLSREEVLRQRALLDELADDLEITVLHGSELNIGPDGSLDYDHDFLMAYDWCVASVHSHFDLDPAAQTDRLLTAIRHPAVNVIGHLTGRRIGKRPGIEFDADAVFAAAAEAGTALEINSNLERLDVPSSMLRHAVEAGCTFVISTDSHHTSELGYVKWGIANARRGWVPKERIANTMDRDEFVAWARSQRTSS